MAEQVQEVVTALTIETGKSYASIAELREAVRGLREQLKQTAFEDENFNKVQKELAATQEALTQVTKMSTAAQAENWEGVDLGTKSYNELTKQMKALNAEWRATTDEVQRQQLGSQILKINDRLKDMDESKNAGVLFLGGSKVRVRLMDVKEYDLASCDNDLPVELEALILTLQEKYSYLFTE